MNARTGTPQGFTLIELSIVLVVIGLIVGSIVAGQSLIRSSQLVSVLSDVKRYGEAVHQFQQKYHELPGDMADATNYWGANTNGGYGCGEYYSPQTSSTSTCNGNGNGTIEGGDSSSSYQLDEQVFLWKHLANAGLIEGSYTGKDMGAFSSVATGINTPASRIPSGGYAIFSNLDIWYPTGGAWIYPWTEVSNVVVFGSNYQGDNSQFGAVITAAEALSIDSKIDDAKPGTGKVRAPRANNGAPWGTASCATDFDPNVAVYNVSQSNYVCSLMFEF